MKFDMRLLGLLAVGVVAAAWAFNYAGDVNSLVQTGTNGYVTMVRGLEPPGMGGGGIGGGMGSIPSNPSIGFGALSGG